MPTILIISVIAVAVVGAIGYVFVFQTVDKKRRQRQRLITALKQRSKNFAHMIKGFPPNLLTKDLNVLVYRCLADVHEQLSKLEPNNSNHTTALQSYQQAMNKAMNAPDSGQRTKMQSLQQAKEIRNHLQDLFKFVEKMLRKRSINGAQAKGYGKQIQKLIVQVTLDGFLINAKQAEQEGKFKVALHNYGLAKNLIEKTNSDKTFDNQLTQITTVMGELAKKAGEDKPRANPQDAGGGNSEWAAYESSDDAWKKKTVYD